MCAALRRAIFPTCRSARLDYNGMLNQPACGVVTPWAVVLAEAGLCFSTPLGPHK
jgi:hypothetical protein